MSSYNPHSLIIFAFLVLAIRLPAQYVSTILYTSENNLPLTETVAVNVDDNGYLWVSMNAKGAARFNGKVFQQMPDIISTIVNTYSAPDGSIWGRYTAVELGAYSIDPSGQVRQLASGGARIDINKHRILRDTLPNGNFYKNPFTNDLFFTIQHYIFKYDTKQKGFVFTDSLPLPAGSFNCYIELDFQNNQHLLVDQASNRSWHYYKKVNGTLQPLLFPNKYPPDRLGYVRQLSGTTVFLHSKWGAFVYAEKAWKSYLEPISQNIRSGAVINVAKTLPDGHLLIELGKGNTQFLYDFDPITTALKVVTFRFTGKPLDVCTDKAGTYWLASHSGLLRIFPAFTNFFATENPAMLTDIHTVVEDKSGKMWFGSYSEGLGFIEKGKVNKSPPQMSGIKNVLPGSICDEQGNLLFSVEGPAPWQGMVKVKNAGRAELVLPSKFGYVFSKNKQGNLLWGTTGNGLFIQRDKTCPYVDSCWIKIGKEKGFELGNVLGVVQDRHGHYWIGRPYTGIAVYLPERDTVISFLKTQGETRYGGWSFATDKWGNIWIGSNAGLLHFNPPATVTADFQLDKYLTPVATSVFGDSDIPSVINYQDTLLAVLTFKGFGLLDLKAFYKKSNRPIAFYFTKEEGYTGGAGEQNSLCMDRLGNLWFANDKGLTCFNPKLFIQDTTLLQVKIDHFSSFGDSLAIHNGRVVGMQSKHTNVNISFTELDDPQLFNRTTFLYQLNKDSLKVADRNSLYFFNLAPGRYNLRVYAARAGMQSEPAILTFRIPRLWYQSIWTYAVAALLTVVVLMEWYRTKEMRYRELLSARVQAIVNQLNPHFINNTLNWVQIRADDRQDQEAVIVISKLASNLRTIFINTRNKRSFHTLQDEIEFVKNYFHIQKTRFEGRLEYQLPDEAIIQRWGKSVQVPLMLLQIHTENAIEHGISNRTGGGYVKIGINENKHFLVLYIEDTGVGREEARRIGSLGTEQGTKMLEELIKVFNLRNKYKIRQYYEDNIFTDDYGKSYGTRVIIEMPKVYEYTLSD